MAPLPLLTLCVPGPVIKGLLEPIQIQSFGTGFRGKYSAPVAMINIRKITCMDPLPLLALRPPAPVM